MIPSKGSRSNRATALGMLGLHDISPTWDRRLSMVPVPFLTKMRWCMDLHDKNRCVVGEAYGFSSKFAKECGICNRIGLDFESHFTRDEYHELECTKAQFVQHWNREHGDITRSLGKRRPLRWYDSFLRFDDHIETFR